MFEKSALLMICCDISTKSFENVPIATKPIKKKLNIYCVDCKNASSNLDMAVNGKRCFLVQMV